MGSFLETYDDLFIQTQNAPVEYSYDEYIKQISPAGSTDHNIFFGDFWRHTISYNLNVGSTLSSFDACPSLPSIVNRKQFQYLNIAL